MRSELSSVCEDPRSESEHVLQTGNCERFDSEVILRPTAPWTTPYNNITGKVISAVEAAKKGREWEESIHTQEYI